MPERSNQDSDQLALAPTIQQRKDSHAVLKKLKVAERFALMFGLGRVVDGKFVMNPASKNPSPVQNKEVDEMDTKLSFFYSSTVLELVPRLKDLERFIKERITQELKYHVRVEGDLSLQEINEFQSLKKTPSGDLEFRKKLSDEIHLTGDPASLPIDMLVPLLEAVHSVTYFNRMAVDLPEETGTYVVELSNGTKETLTYWLIQDMWVDKPKEGSTFCPRVGVGRIIRGKRLVNFTRLS